MVTNKNDPINLGVQAQDCPTALSQLIILVEDSVEAALGPLGFDLEVVSRDSVDEDTGGLWGAIIAEPLKVADAAIAETFDFDPASIAAGKTKVRNALVVLFDPDSIQAALEPITDIGKVTVATTGVLLGTGDPTEVINQKLSPLSDKYKNAPTPCAQNVLVATAATVTRVIAGTANEVLKKVGAAQALLGMSMSMLNNFGEGLFLLIGSELDRVYTLEVTLLSQIEYVLAQIEQILIELGDEPFSFNHPKVVQDARVNLLLADSVLSQVQSRIQIRAGLNEAAYDQARSLVQQVEQMLCDASEELIPGFSSKPYKLLALFRALEVYTQQWIRQSTRVQAQVDGMLAFPTSLKAQLQVDNFFAPILDLVRCQLQHVTEDMANVALKGQLLLYVAKEHKWCLQLKVLNETMKASRSLLETGDNAAKFSDDVLIFVSEYEAQQQAITAQPQAVFDVLEVALTQIRLKVQNQATPAAVVRAYVAQALGLATLRRQQLEAQRPLLLELLSLGSNKYVKAWAQAKQYTEFLTGKGLSTVLKGLVTGDLDAVFGANATTAAIEDKVQAHVVKVMGCLKDKDPASVDKLTQVAKQASDDSRSKALITDRVGGAASLFAFEALLESAERQINLSTIQL